MRCRLRYLSHLPITCQFQVAELALKPPTVSNSTLSHFHNDIEKRRKIRQRRMRDERQRSRKIQIAENKKIGICEYKVVLLKTIEPTLKSDFHIKNLQLLPMRLQEGPWKLKGIHCSVYGPPWFGIKHFKVFSETRTKSLLYCYISHDRSGNES